MASVVQIIRRRRRRRALRRMAQVRGRRGVGIVVVLVLLLGVLPTGVAVGGAAVWYWQALAILPTPEETVAVDPVIGPTELYDHTGQTLLFSVRDPLGDERTWVTLDELPPYVVHATLLYEGSPTFLTHTRFDPVQTFARLWNNLINGPLDPDPTLTGRLVRNVIAPPPEVASVEYRALETALVAEINRRYTSQQILEWHLNTNHYGNAVYGIEAAAQVYLGKHAAELTLDEAALLAAIPTAPQYNPLDDELAARGRQSDLLRALLVNGYITPQQYDEASSRITPVRRDTGQRIASDFVLYARRQAENILDSLGRDGPRLVARGGLRIVTTLDLDLYYQSECALQTHLARLNGQPVPTNALDGNACAGAAYLPPLSAPAGDRPPDEGAIVVIDAQTGQLLSIVGPVTSVAYQPGPVLYPFVYFEGFRSGLFNPATMVLDIPTRFPGAAEGLIYTPANADGQFRGPMNLRDAMGAGLLPPAVQVANARGVDNVLRVAHRMGINSLDEGVYDLSLLERGGAVSLLDVTYAYSVFATLGEMRGVPVQPLARGYRGRDPVAVLRIEDADGQVLWEYDDEQVALNHTPIFEPGLGYLVNDILADRETRWPLLGQNNVLDLPRPVAVVNGVTGGDAWTVGYTPHIVTGVHLGRTDRQSLTLDTYGLTGAAPVWRAVMDYLHNRDSLPVASWERPDNIIEVRVCERSGLLPNDACPVRSEIFLENTQPFQPDRYWQVFEVNSQTGLLATTNTPAGLRDERVYFVPPPEAADWWRANNLPLPPTEYDTVTRPDLFGATQILQPEAFAYVGGVVDIRGSIDDTNMQFYQLAYGQGLNPSEWTQIGGQQTEYTRGGTLGTWDTRGLDGLYNLRLTVVYNDNTIETNIVQVTVDNIPPTIELLAGEPGQMYQWPGDDVVRLEAAVVDNLAIDRVEFYHNGEFLGTDEEWPYGFEWPVNRVGTETFTAVAFDAVGNQASTEITVEVVRAGS